MSDNDNIAELLFKIKSRYLGEIPHPKLIEKGINELMGMGAVISISGMNNLPDKNTGLINFLEVYIARLMELKLEIASGKEINKLATDLSVLRDMHLQLIEKLSSYCDFELEMNDEVKQSTPINAYSILKHLNSNKIEEKEISPYIRKQIGLEGPLDSLTYTCVQCRKIIDHGR